MLKKYDIHKIQLCTGVIILRYGKENRKGGVRKDTPFVTDKKLTKKKKERKKKNKFTKTQIIIITNQHDFSNLSVKKKYKKNTLVE